MGLNYEITNLKLKSMVEKQAKEFGMTLDELILAYINRGLMSDNINQEVFWEVHSEKYMSVVNKALDVD